MHKSVDTDTVLPILTLSKIVKSRKKSKGKAIPVQAWTDPEGSSRLRFPDFMAIGT
jgi:hypothetical protein